MTQPCLLLVNYDAKLSCKQHKRSCFAKLWNTDLWNSFTLQNLQSYYDQHRIHNWAEQSKNSWIDQNSTHKLNMSQNRLSWTPFIITRNQWCCPIVITDKCSFFLNPDCEESPNWWKVRFRNRFISDSRNQRVFFVPGRNFQSRSSADINIPCSMQMQMHNSPKRRDYNHHCRRWILSTKCGKLKYSFVSPFYLRTKCYILKIKNSLAEPYHFLQQKAYNL